VSGQKASGTKVADPKVITTGGPDVVFLDTKNTLWRWRPLPANGKGTLAKINVEDSATWGDDIEVMSTFVANFDAALYKLYVVDPSEQNIMVLSPNIDGSGYSSAPNPRLPTDRAVDGITDVLIDGDIFVAENGAVARVIPASGWKPELPADTRLRPPSPYTMLASPDRADGSTSRRKGLLYAFDARNHRIVAFNKSDGAYVAQYRAAGDEEAWTGLLGMTVLPAPADGEPATLWWISSTGLHSALLVAAPGGPSASPSPSASTRPTALPTATPRPTRTPKP
jgi:Ni,Fe-hydrogenase III small subunit